VLVNLRCAGCSLPVAANRTFCTAFGTERLQPSVQYCSWLTIHYRDVGLSLNSSNKSELLGAVVPLRPVFLRRQRQGRGETPGLSGEVWGRTSRCSASCFFLPLRVVKSIPGILQASCLHQTNRCSPRNEDRAGLCVVLI
jgi:hypothetical protein